jgi:hypothetical protein
MCERAAASEHESCFADITRPDEFEILGQRIRVNRPVRLDVQQRGEMNNEKLACSDGMTQACHLEVQGVTGGDAKDRQGRLWVSIL